MDALFLVATTPDAAINPVAAPEQMGRQYFHDADTTSEAQREMI